MKKLILTLDYELYGDGSGDVFEHMIEPTERILEICNRDNIKITLFFEVLEYIKLKEQWEQGDQMGYFRNPVAAIKKQIQEMAMLGHDIQLHVHPQWAKAEYIDDRWRVDYDNWRLGDFCVEGSYSIEDMLREGKEIIEEMIREVVPSYRCSVLRAGGYNIMPTGAVYRAMVNVGLAFDSSVYPGGYETGSLSRYDFRHAPHDKDYWPVEADDFCKTDAASKVMEIPVFALPQRRIKKFTLGRIRSVLQNRASATKTLKAKAGKKTFIEKVGYLLGKEAFTWDFCLFSFGMHKMFLGNIQRSFLERRVFVLVGHPKSFSSDKAFVKFLRFSQTNGFQFVTLSDII